MDEVRDRRCMVTERHAHHVAGCRCIKPMKSEEQLQREYTEARLARARQGRRCEDPDCLCHTQGPHADG